MLIRPITSIVAVLALSVPAGATIPEAVPDLPVLGPETKVGSIVTSAAAPVAPAPKTVDGDISDWTGESTRLGGTSIYSHGELIYQDFIGDAWGADDGDDAARLALLHTVKAMEPRTYRIDTLQQAAGDQFDAPRPIGALTHYGDTSSADAERTQADIQELRVAADADNLYFMIRTTSMVASPSTAVMLFMKQAESERFFDLPRGYGGVRTSMEWAFLISRDGITPIHRGIPLVIGCGPGPCVPPYEAAFNAAGFVNAVEVRIARSFISGLAADGTAFAAATGIYDPALKQLAVRAEGDAQSDLVNVAFRKEPARIWMDERQALALRMGGIDSFMTWVSFDRMMRGDTETFIQRPGYYEAIYTNDSSPVNREEVTNQYHQGMFQHYGVYLPESYRPGATHPATFWMHYRGGHAHDAAAWVPGILRNFGDDIDAIVVTPSARGTSTWYTGRGMVDFLDVWDDSMSRWSIDEDRVYLAGHSMGGWASNFLGLVFPDRWAASNPQDGLLTPGFWAGAGKPAEPQNGADVNAEFLYPLLGNARNLPFAVLHGTADELIPFTAIIAQGLRLHELGYRYRVYMHHTYEHYSAPIMDDWREVVGYMKQFRRDRDPARVTYSIKPALDHAASTISVPAGVDLGFRFDRAYWVSGLRTRKPGIDPTNIGTIDAISHGRGVPEIIPVPEAGTAGQVEPYTMHGQRWLPNGTSFAENFFEATMTNLSTATLDVSRMGLGTSGFMVARVETDGAATLRLKGPWPASIVVDGVSGWSRAGDIVELRFDSARTYDSVSVTPTGG